MESPRTLSSARVENVFDSKTEEKESRFLDQSCFLLMLRGITLRCVDGLGGWSLFIERHTASHSIEHVKDVYALKSRRTTVSLRSCDSLTIDEYRSGKVCRLADLFSFSLSPFFSVLLSFSSRRVRAEAEFYVSTMKGCGCNVPDVNCIRC